MISETTNSNGGLLTTREEAVLPKWAQSTLMDLRREIQNLRSLKTMEGASILKALTNDFTILVTRKQLLTMPLEERRKLLEAQAIEFIKSNPNYSFEDIG